MIEPDSHAIELLAACAELQNRKAAAAKLAKHFGAANLFVFIADSELRGKLVPAPGFISTLPGGDGWRELLDRARESGFYRRAVRVAKGGEPQSASAFSDGELVLVFTGGEVDPSKVEQLLSVAPLLRGMLRAEHSEFVARGQLQVVRHEAQQASALATALDGTRTALQSTLADLEEKTRKLENARAKAEESARVKDDFLAMLGHELRNPLAPIFTALEVLQLKGTESELLDIIRRQAAHLSRLVDDLLDVSRITQGKIVLRKEPVEVAKLVERSIEMASPLLDEKRQTLTVDVPSSGMEINADSARFAQILSNLLTNASKYSPTGTHIELRAERAGDLISVSVKDEGDGIAPSELERIFEWFAQQKQSVNRADGGLGLGLAIVKSLVELHDGTIAVSSEGLGKGSEFVVEVPAVRQQSEPADDEPREHGGMQTERSAKRVLVVDDNEDAAVLLGEALEVCGYQTRVAFDGPAALNIVDEFVPDVVLADIGLPIMDGYELAGRLRDWAGERSLFLVAVTGYGQKSDRLRAFDEGFDAHLVKPVDLKDVRDVLDSVA